MKINPEVFARNCVQMLQEDPKAYRSFGIYWWPVKAILKRFYSRDELSLLGNYEDPIGAEAVPRVGLQEMLMLAIEEHQSNQIDHINPQWVQLPDGAPYMIYDEDADDAS